MVDYTSLFFLLLVDIVIVLFLVIFNKAAMKFLALSLFMIVAFTF